MMRPRSALARDIALVLVVKLTALLVLWGVWFAHPDVPDADRVAGALLSPQVNINNQGHQHGRD